VDTGGVSCCFASLSATTFIRSPCSSNDPCGGPNDDEPGHRIYVIEDPVIIDS